MAGHPRALQVKEELILNELIEFMGRRLFGPERLRLLRDELARSVAEGWPEHDTQLAQLRLELEDLDRASTARRCGWRSTRIPATPSSRSPRGASRISASAGARSRTRSATSKRAGPTAPGPTRSRPCSPLSPTSGPVSRPPAPKSSRDLLEAFDVTAVYDKAGRTLELGATVMPELVPDQGKTPTERRPVGDMLP